MPALPLSPEQFEELVGLAVAWAEVQERRILESGMALTRAQTADAFTMGVVHPERVRLLPVVAISRPEHPVLRAAAETAQIINPFTRGLTLRYGIYLRADEYSDRFLIAHELVHTGQYERMGGFLPFLRQYIHECLTVGYYASPMEQEAILKTKSLLMQLE
jgi:mRNA-degrading endonuclease toxin of MazEF toxin-antitoxin module